MAVDASKKYWANIGQNPNKQHVPNETVQSSKLTESHEICSSNSNDGKFIFLPFQMKNSL